MTNPKIDPKVESFIQQSMTIATSEPIFGLEAECILHISSANRKNIAIGLSAGVHINVKEQSAAASITYREVCEEFSVVVNNKISEIYHWLEVFLCERKLVKVSEQKDLDDQYDKKGYYNKKDFFSALFSNPNGVDVVIEVFLKPCGHIHHQIAIF